MRFKICNCLHGAHITTHVSSSHPFDFVKKAKCKANSILVFDGKQWKLRELDCILSNISGPTGPIGMTGPRGFRGEQGVNGEKGEEGPLGPRGLKGDIGPTGPAGYATYSTYSTGIQQSLAFSIIEDATNLFIGNNAGKEEKSLENVYAGINAGIVESGGGNTHYGFEAGKFNKGRENTIVGNNAVSANDCTGNDNAIFGSEAGYRLSSGFSNSFFGRVAGANVSSGFNNSGLGTSAGHDLTNGHDNIFVGKNAGNDAVSAENCIFIGNDSAASISNPENQIVIGNGVVSFGNNTVTFPDNLTTFPNGTEVNFSSSGGGCLYPVSSSRRWKNEIKNIHDTIDTSKVFDLEAVTYKPAVGHGDVNELYIGLIAEEVDPLFPQLVPKDKYGQPASVRYSLLSVLLLEEMKKIKRELIKILPVINE